MNCKKLNLIEIFLNVVALVLLFIPGMFQCGMETNEKVLITNAFTDLPTDNPFGNVISIIFVVLVVLTLIFCVWFALSKTKLKLNIMQILLPISATVIFLVVGALYAAGEYATFVEQLAVELYDTTSTYSLGPYFYVELILLFLMCFISIIKKYSFFERNSEEDKIVETT